MADEEHLLNVTSTGPVGVIELARPAKFNCLSVRTFERLISAIDAFEGAPEIRAVLIRAEGKNFCTGAELDEVKAIRPDEKRVRHFLDTGHAALSRLEASRLPVVAAVQGLCLAGGLELMLACDIVYAAQGARFGDQHAQFGLVPGWGGSQRLPRIVGMRRALDLFMTVRWIDAPTAESWGLVNYVVPDDALQDEAMACCNAIASRSAEGIGWMKRLAREGMDGPLDAGLKREAAVLVDALQSRDVSEGLAAFEARRAPQFG